MQRSSSSSKIWLARLAIYYLQNYILVYVLGKKRACSDLTMQLSWQCLNDCKISWIAELNERKESTRLSKNLFLSRKRNLLPIIRIVSPSHFIYLTQRPALSRGAKKGHLSFFLSIDRLSSTTSFSARRSPSLKTSPRQKQTSQKQQKNPEKTAIDKMTKRSCSSSTFCKSEANRKWMSGGKKQLH